MRQFLPRQLLLSALLATAIACSDSGATSTSTASTGTSPSGIITETFSGTLTLNGAASFPFSTATSGSINATLTSFTPDTTLQVGLWLGVWDGVRCASGVVNDRIAQSGNVPAFAPSSGIWCVRIYDSMGTVPASPGGDAYLITVTHP